MYNLQIWEQSLYPPVFFGEHLFWGNERINDLREREENDFHTEHREVLKYSYFYRKQTRKKSQQKRFIQFYLTYFIAGQ